MTNLRFIWNLSRDTHAATTNGHARPVGYLIAPDNARGALGNLASDVAQSRRLLFADNGNFERIGQIRKRHQTEATAVRAIVSDTETALGRSAKRSDLDPATRRQIDALIAAVRHDAVTTGLDARSMLDSQQPLDPDRIVGAEDLTMACWLSLDLEPRITAVRRRDYLRYNATVTRHATSVLGRLPLDRHIDYHPVASAMSYNTAYDAGRVFASAGIQSVSMGFGAFMADSNWADHLKIGRRTVRFGRRLPFRYIRTAAVAAGFWAGYQDETGTAPKRFHFLGLGAPIVFGAVATAAKATPELTFDATSPIKDATRGGTLYIDKPATLKIRTRMIAHRLARESSHRWDCPCPFCTAFVAQHPFDYTIGHDWHSATGATAVTATDLRPGGALFNAYPLLSEPASGPLRTAVNYTRTGHNHWIIERSMTSVERAAQKSDAALDVRVDNLADDYRQHTRSHFADAVTVANDIARHNT